MTYTPEELGKILCAHERWLRGEEDGVRANLYHADLLRASLCGINLCGATLFRADLCRADLSGSNLYNADLRESNLSYATLSRADLCRVNLSGSNLCNADLRESNLCDATLFRADLCKADLSGSNLCNADLHESNLCKADLRGANLSGANLRGANLSGADLRGTNLSGIRVSEFTSGYFMTCPEKGAYIGFKKCQKGRIVELLIPEDAFRSSATTRKCRASKAKVLSITSIGGTIALNDAVSNYACDFIYRVGETIEVLDFDPDRWKECAAGIHHFITREEAEIY